MKWLTTVLCAALLSGCLSAVRIPFCHATYSDDGVCTNRVWYSFLSDLPQYRVYPTIKMRCHAMAEWWKPIDPAAKGETLYKQRMFKRWGWIPLGVIWLTSPLDAAVDTVFLPYDILVNN